MIRFIVVDVIKYGQIQILNSCLFTIESIITVMNLHQLQIQAEIS